MISLTPQISSSYFVKLNENTEDTNIDRLSRRVSRIATLDRGSVMNDSGFTDSDRTLLIAAKITAAQKASLDYMLETYSLWNVATRVGLFSCTPQDMDSQNGQLKLTLLAAE